MLRKWVKKTWKILYTFNSREQTITTTKSVQIYDHHCMKYFEYRTVYALDIAIKTQLKARCEQQAEQKQQKKLMC